MDVTSAVWGRKGRKVFTASSLLLSFFIQVEICTSVVHIKDTELSRGLVVCTYADSFSPVVRCSSLPFLSLKVLCVTIGVSIV